MAIRLHCCKNTDSRKTKYLAAGVIDGRNVWRADLDKKVTLLDEIQAHVEKERLIVQSSSSLLHVPVSTEPEEQLDPIIKGGLAFADEKIAEIVLLTKGVQEGTGTIAKGLEESRKATCRAKQFQVSTKR